MHKRDCVGWEFVLRMSSSPLPKSLRAKPNLLLAKKKVFFFLFHLTWKTNASSISRNEVVSYRVVFSRVSDYSLFFLFRRGINLLITCVVCSCRIGFEISCNTLRRFESIVRCWSCEFRFPVFFDEIFHWMFSISRWCFDAWKAVNVFL